MEVYNVSKNRQYISEDLGRIWNIFLRPYAGERSLCDESRVLSEIDRPCGRSSGSKKTFQILRNRQITKLHDNFR